MPCPTKPYKAILFDFDGVLADTMEDNYLAWAQAFSAYGIALEREAYFLLEGMNITGVVESLLKGTPIDPSLGKQIASRKEAAYAASHEFKLYPGAARLIDSLRGSYQLGLVSGASAARMKMTVPQAFLNKFHVVIDGDAVKHSKPHPEPYRRAAKALGVAPGECLVVENAPLGIASAKGAGMDCVAVTSTLDLRHLVGADHIVQDINAVRAILAPHHR